MVWSPGQLRSGLYRCGAANKCERVNIYWRIPGARLTAHAHNELPTGARVPPVLIECPVTDSLVPTGESADSLEDLDAEGHILIACPDCSRDHEWRAQDAVIASQ